MYELGALIAAVMVCLSLAANLMSSWTALGSNLALMDLRVSIFTGQPVPLGRRSLLGKILRASLWIVSLIVSAALSWITVISMAGMFLYKKSKDAGAPQSIKELRWRMKNIHMTREQIDKEIAQAHESAMGSNHAYAGDRNAI